jgi:hypothetical protein
MTVIYLDPSAAAMPGTASQLGHLVDTGHEVVLVGDLDREFHGVPPGAAHVDQLPAEPVRGSWFVTADAATCAERRPGLKTLLIGPRPAPSPRPAPRCDAEARDLASAVLEILGREVMG